ncbi:MAG: AAA family ATPase [Anaerolineae bacterium]|nr:AAA family ATPase [Anaerolineae bacterium]
MQRFVVVGTSGSGKSTLAEQIASKLNIPHIELDALHWGPNWTSSPPEELRPRVENALQGDSWVIDGNYSVVRDIVWTRADTLIWLDYSLPLVLWRINKRTLKRGLTRQTLWNGNKETLWKHFFIPKESLYWWVLKTHYRHRHVYPLAFAEYAHLTVCHFHSPKETARWLNHLQPRS